MSVLALTDGCPSQTARTQGAPTHWNKTPMRLFAFFGHVVGRFR